MSMNKTMRKNDWLEIANGTLNLGVSELETVNDIVIKIANELNIESNSVSITDLKKNILIQIELINQRNPIMDEFVIDESIQEENTEVLNETIAPTQEVTIQYSELDNLRAECIMYGVAYTEKHTITDLTQLLNQIRPHVTPTMTLEEALKQIVPSTDNNEVVDETNFELTIDNIDIVKDIAPSSNTTNNSTNTASIQLEVKQIAVPVASIKDNLETYRASFTQTIRGHFRPQTISEIESLFTHNYPFKYRIIHNPKNRLQVEMKFIINDVEVRVPSDNPNDWFNIRD
jgi:hypothetical protein